MKSTFPKTIVWTTMMLAASALQARPIRVACIGDSITDKGTHTVKVEGKKVQENYPEVMARILEEKAPGRFEVANFGKGGTTAAIRQNPWWREGRLDHLARTRAFQPDIVIAMFGGNDMAQWGGNEGLFNGIEYPWCAFYAEEFLWRKVLSQLERKPRVILGTPPRCFGDVAGYRWSTNWPLCEVRLTNWVARLGWCDQVAARLKARLGTEVPVVDTLTLTSAHKEWFAEGDKKDGIHPSKAGYDTFAALFADEVIKVSSGIDPKNLPALKPVRTKPKTFTVAADAQAIDDALDAARPGDTVRVNGGTVKLSRPILLAGRAKLVFEGGADGRETVLQHDTSLTGRVIEVTSCDEVTIRNFTVTGGRTVGLRSAKDRETGATYCTTADGAGIVVSASKGIRIEACDVYGNEGVDHNNWCAFGGGGIGVSGSKVEIVDTKIRDNAFASTSTAWSYSGGGGVHFNCGAGVTNVMRNCTVTGNRHSTKARGDVAYGEGGGVFNHGATPKGKTAFLLVENCTFAGNTVSNVSKKASRPYENHGDDLAGFNIIRK